MDRPAKGSIRGAPIITQVEEQEKRLKALEETLKLHATKLQAQNEDITLIKETVGI